MSNEIIINSKLKPFKKKISVSGDKSISIRWLLFASLANGISKAKNLLMSDDVRRFSIRCAKFLENPEDQGFTFFAFLPPYFGVSGSLMYLHR